MAKNSQKVSKEAIYSKLSSNMYLFFKMATLSYFDLPGGERVSLSELSMLSRIAEIGSAYVTELANENGVTKGAVSLIVTKLTKKGLVQKTVNPEFRTKVSLTLTEAGQHIAQEYERIHRENNASLMTFLDSLKEKDAKIIGGFLDQMEMWLLNFKNTDRAGLMPLAESLA
jgi:DNA-binding MarR family transcriptional regulator